jgi:hypothetical protein
VLLKSERSQRAGKGIAAGTKCARRRVHGEDPAARLAKLPCRVCEEVAFLSLRAPKKYGPVRDKIK